jgi:hypothetical protein
MRKLLLYITIFIALLTQLNANLDVQFTPANPSVCKGKSITIQAQLTGVGTSTFSFPYSKLSGTEIYVSPAGNDATGTGTIGNPYKTIQKAISVSTNGKIITLLDGTYSGSGNFNLSLQGKQITVQSQNGPLVTTIDCNQSGRAFLVNQGETINTVIKGITIMNGKANSAPIGYASAIFVEDNSGITIKECFFRNNTQGTIQLGDTEVSGPQSKIEHCAFISNVDGCIHSSKKSFMVEACLFINNTSSGGLVGNGHVADPAQQYKNCVFVCNTAQTIAGINHGKVISNSLFISNSTNLGVVYAGTNWSGMNTIDHCTFYNNTCSYYNSTWYDHKGEAKSTIFYPGNARDHYSGNQSIIPFYYCLGNNISGNGNIQGDPKFVDPNAFNFALQSSSPCIGKGEGGTNMGANASLIPSWLLDYVKANTTLASISWDGGSKNPTATFTPTTTKYHKVTFSGCGISYTDSVLITVKEDITFSKADTSCGSYLWNGNVYTASGKYTNTFTSYEGCDSIVTLDLVVHTKPNPVITGTQLICLNQQNTPYSVPNVANSLFLWKQPQKGLISGSLQQPAINVNWNVIGLDTLFVTQTNLLTGCTKDTFLIINIYNTPNPLISGKKQTCIDDKNVEYSTQFTTGMSYQWSTPKNGIIKTGINTNLVKIDWNSIGLDTLKLTMTDNISGCSADTTFIVQIHPKPMPIITGSSSICIGAMYSSYTVPNETSSSFLWKQPKKGNVRGSLNNPELKIDWTSPGIDTIQISQTNLLTGCVKDTFMIIHIHFPPAPLITGEKVQCIGSKNVQYAVKPQIPGMTYQWILTGKGTIRNGVNTPYVVIDWIAEGIDTLKVNVKDVATGCSKDTMFIVEITPLPKPIITGNTSVCEKSKDNTYEIEYKPGHTYEWIQPKLGRITSNPKSSSISIDWDLSGVDTLKVKEYNVRSQCSKDTFLLVTVQNTLLPKVIPFAEEFYLCEGDSRGLECSISADYYSWKFNGEIIQGSNQKVLLAFRPGNYSVFTRIGDCDGESKEITITEKEKPHPIINGQREVELLQNNLEYQADSTFKESSLEWFISSKGSIIGENRGRSVKINALDSGVIVLSVIEKSLFDCIGLDSFLINVKKPIINDISDDIHESLQILPNPVITGEQFRINGLNGISEKYTIEFFDVLGRNNYIINDISISSNGTLDLIAPLLQEGIYFIKISSQYTIRKELIYIR